MKTIHLAGALAFASVLTACVAQVPPPPPPPPMAPRAEAHPVYLRALSDLRAARWLVAHRGGNYAASQAENAAIAEIDATINEIKHAAWDDGKNLDDHPPVDERLDRAGRLHRADELLRKARNDITREEDNPAARAWRNAAIRHLDDGIRWTDQAIREVA